MRIRPRLHTTESNTDWKSIRAVIVKDDFIANIVNFNTDQISLAITAKIRNEFVRCARVAVGHILCWHNTQVLCSHALRHFSHVFFP